MIFLTMNQEIQRGLMMTFLVKYFSKAKGSRPGDRVCFLLNISQGLQEIHQEILRELVSIVLIAYVLQTQESRPRHPNRTHEYIPH